MRPVATCIAGATKVLCLPFLLHGLADPSHIAGKLWIWANWAEEKESLSVSYFFPNYPVISFFMLSKPPLGVSLHPWACIRKQNVCWMLNIQPFTEKCFPGKLSLCHASHEQSSHTGNCPRSGSGDAQGPLKENFLCWSKKEYKENNHRKKLLLVAYNSSYVIKSINTN